MLLRSLTTKPLRSLEEVLLLSSLRIGQMKTFLTLHAREE
jgi:hypothetical protein